jgi:heme exporter protein D
MTLEQFFAMGGYAFYVWTAYGIALVVLLLNVALPLLRKASTHKDVQRALKQDAARQQRQQP